MVNSEILWRFAVARPGGVFMADIIYMSLLLTSVAISGVTPSSPDRLRLPTAL